MGARLPSVVSNTVLNSPIVTTTETVICTTPPFSPSIDGVAVLILATWTCTPGTSANAMTARLRRGSAVGGAQLQAAPYPNPCGAIANQGGMLWYFDQPGIIGGQQYSLTLAMAGATGNTTVTDVAMLAFAL
jgi:hypothetical protein